MRPPTDTNHDAFPTILRVLCHITSLPAEAGVGESGIGDLGDAAFRFVDFLKSAGQGVWQILPLGPPAHGNSPYSCYSAFAGNPLLISLPRLVHNALLSQSEVQSARQVTSNARFVDYKSVAAVKQPLLERAFANFCRQADPELRAQFEAFDKQNAGWLDDFARFEALMRHFDESDWSRWPTELVQRKVDAVAAWDSKLCQEIEFSKFQQFLFDAQWIQLKQYANDHGVRMYGDMPIFVAHESADVWANQEIFALDALGKPTMVAGVPPDYFSSTGQLWGNPQYRWDVLESNDYAWWTARFGYALHQFDLLRVDHFRGFEAYWEVPASAKTAVTGQWRKGPCEKPFEAAKRKLGELPFVAEDLGLITEKVHQLRDLLGFPGMRVMQFGFDRKEDDFHRPGKYPEHSVAYTGTHDNDTMMGWYRKRKIDPKQGDLLAEFVTGTTDIHLQLVGAVLNSASDTAIVPVQDLLGLGNEARMNMPGQAHGNWAWRLESGLLIDSLAAQIREMTRNARR